MGNGDDILILKFKCVAYSALTISLFEVRHEKGLTQIRVIFGTSRSPRGRNAVSLNHFLPPLVPLKS